MEDEEGKTEKGRRRREEREGMTEKGRRKVEDGMD